MAKKYFLNNSSKRLHKEGGCRHYRKPPVSPFEGLHFDKIDDVIKHSQRYFHYCKICFKEEEKED